MGPQDPSLYANVLCLTDERDSHYSSWVEAARSILTHQRVMRLESSKLKQRPLIVENYRLFYFHFEEAAEVHALVINDTHEERYWALTFAPYSRKPDLFLCIRERWEGVYAFEVKYSSRPNIASGKILFQQPRRVA